ncbi:hypothetical protein EXIGLDRAFT_696725 [Exidia glandulosa HHB12029]|uniref:Uncharacterized protein n=1 Tax=Exidia glandulosa HHB12029 TaxID=1314781 RepID=A0A165N2Q2_EXIGL|nr:hypothetical protein EXIGLDRAFT_696725 [Exidia glandulosa HHB12029]
MPGLNHYHSSSPRSADSQPERWRPYPDPSARSGPHSGLGLNTQSPGSQFVGSLPGFDDFNPSDSLLSMDHRRSRTPPQPVSIPLPALEVELVATTCNLDTVQRRALHAFNEAPLQRQLVEMQAQLLRNQTQIASVKNQVVQALEPKFADMSQLHMQEFTPKKTSTDHMRATIRHYLVTPLRNYMNVDDSAKSYYLRKPQSFKIPAYKTSADVRRIVDKLLQRFGNEVRGNLRVLVFSKVTDGVALDLWAAHMMKHFYMHGGKTVEPSKMLKARLALMRQIAAPIVAAPRKQGEKTNFWTLLQNQVNSLYVTHKEDLEAAGWQEWADKIIAEDEQKYKERPAELDPPSFDGTDDEDSSPAA